MAASSSRGPSPQYPPSIHSEVYPFIYPIKFKDSLKNKVTLITGSAGTLGLALAECFAVAGANLVLVYNKTEPPASIKERCTELGARGVSLIKCNVSELQSCQDLVKQVLESHGGVDILINNAGANSLGLVHAQAPEDFIYNLAVNLHGPYFLMRLLVPTFREQKSGCVINMASRAGAAVIPYSASYHCSKAALINLTGCIQKEFDLEEFRDVHLYSVHPGALKSTMTINKYSESTISNLPEVAQNWYRNLLDGYNDSPYLNGMVCVALATGVAKETLKGRYVDVEHDLEDVMKQTEAVKADPDMYSLGIKLLGGLSNYTHPRGSEEPFQFPGF